MATLDPNNPASKYHAVNHVSLAVQSINAKMECITADNAAAGETGEKYEKVDFGASGKGANAAAAANWAGTLAAVTPTDSPSLNAHWYDCPRIPRAGRTISQVQFRSPPRKPRKKSRYIPRSPASDELPLPLNLAEKMIELLRIGAYNGTFPTTLGEYRRIQQYRDAGGRGRNPLPRPRGYWMSDAGCRDWYRQPLFVDVETLVKSWGWYGEIPIIHAELAIIIEALCDIHKRTRMFHDDRRGLNAEVHKHVVESGYETDAESSGGKEGGKYGYKEHENYDFAPKGHHRRRLPVDSDSKEESYEALWVTESDSDHSTDNFPRFHGSDDDSHSRQEGEFSESLDDEYGCHSSDSYETPIRDDGTVFESSNSVDTRSPVVNDCPLAGECLGVRNDTHCAAQQEEDDENSADGYERHLDLYSEDHTEEHPESTSVDASSSSPAATDSGNSQNANYDEDSNNEERISYLGPGNNGVTAVGATASHRAVQAGWKPTEERAMDLLLEEISEEEEEGRN